MDDHAQNDQVTESIGDDYSVLKRIAIPAPIKY